MYIYITKCPLGLFAAMLLAAVLGLLRADLGAICTAVFVALRRSILLNDPELLCDIEVISMRKVLSRSSKNNVIYSSL